MCYLSGISGTCDWCAVSPDLFLGKCSDIMDLSSSERLGIQEIRFRNLDSCEIRLCEIRPCKGALTEGGSSKMGSFEIRPIKSSIFKDAFLKVCPIEESIGENSADEVSTPEICSLEMRTGQVGSCQVSFIELGTYQIGLLQVPSSIKLTWQEPTWPVRISREQISGVLTLSALFSPMLSSMGHTLRKASLKILDLIGRISNEPILLEPPSVSARSEERRVGKECRSR